MKYSNLSLERMVVGETRGKDRGSHNYLFDFPATMTLNLTFMLLLNTLCHKGLQEHL